MSTDDQTNPRGAQRNRPETVDALASTVISVLRDRQSVSFDGLRQFVLDHMLRAVLNQRSFAPDNLLAELRGYRLTVDSIIDHYVPTTARMLGDHWVEDRINFAEVTIGVMRLQSLLAEATASVRPRDVPAQDQLDALVVIPQGEQHFLGASVLAGQMRRLGCEVSMSYDEDFDSLTERLHDEAPDLILITCARRETLESVADTVQTIRNAVGTSPVLAVGGAIQMKEKDVIELTGADVVTKIAEEAVTFCVQRRRSQKST
jgi:hypothetical protein